MTNGWSRSKLQDLTTKIGSGATPLGGEATYKSQGVSLIRSLNVHDTGFRTKDLAFLDEKQASDLDNVVVEPEDVLLNITGASIARSCVVPPSVLPARVNQHVAILRPRREKLFPRFLYYLLISPDYKTHLLGAGEAGATRQALTKTQLQSLSIAYPPLPEQQRIVGILDEAFAAIAIARTNTEKNLRNARAVLQNTLHAIFVNGRRGWETKRLPDIAEYYIGLTYSPKDVSQKGTIVLRSSNIQNGKLDFSDIVRVDRPIKPGLFVKTGDVLMCSRNGSKRLVGKTALLADLPEEMTFGTFMTIIRSKYNEYLSWFFTSDAFREQIGVGENTMINQVTKYMLDAILVPLPPQSEREEILRRLASLSAQTKRLASLYHQKLAALDALKKSLLHQAFSGKL